MDTDQQVKSIFNPIMDVMSGADGGVAFAQLCHSFMPMVVENATIDKNAEDILKAFKVVARACEIVQGKVPTIHL